MNRTATHAAGPTPTGPHGGPTARGTRIAAGQALAHHSPVGLGGTGVPVIDLSAKSCTGTTWPRRMP